VKKSRFVARLAPCTDLTQAREFRREVADTSVSHNVWAAVLRTGEAGSSDDGEPAGTAGMPARQVLEKGGLADAVVVITRYYGGTKLGTGGLVRAYSGACKAAVDAAQWEDLRPGVRLDVSGVPAEKVSALYNIVGNWEAVQLVEDPTFSSEGSAAALLWVPQEDADSLEKELISLARDQVVVSSQPE